MKISTLIIGLALPLACADAFAADYTCKPITGTVNQLTPDPACTILQAKPKHFTNIAFLQSAPNAPTCFASTLTATLGNTAVTGTVSSGLTANGVGQLTAASAIQLNSNAVEIGRIYTTDVIFDPNADTKELLTMVDGSRLFKDGKGSLEIIGNALYSNTTFSGTLCTEN